MTPSSTRWGILLLLASWWSLAAAESGSQVHRIGVLNQAWAANHPAVEGLKAGLETQGIEEHRDVIFEIRFTSGDPAATRTAAADLVAASADLIFTSGDAATKAAVEATGSVPIVFTLVGDPVAAGIVTEMARPGGNVTGVSSLSTELVGKRLEILKALAPPLVRVWALHYADDAPSIAAIVAARRVARALGLQVASRSVHTPRDLVDAFAALPPGDGLLPPPVATLDIPAQVLDASLSGRFPAVFGSGIWVRYGALVSYGSDYRAEGFQAARLVAKILRGARPADLPVEDPEHAAQAIRSALRIEVELEQRRFDVGDAADPVRLATRIGINSGPVVGGTVGSGGRLGYTVHGDAVNVAARIQELNKQFGTRILISGSTVTLAEAVCGGEFEFDAAGESMIRGRQQHVMLYRVRGPHTAYERVASATV